MKIIKTSPLLALAIVLAACSSDKPAPFSPTYLSTTPNGQAYFYCESCPTPTKLTKGAYKPLEPDEPIIEEKPQTSNQIIITNNKRSIHKPRKNYKHKPKVKKIQQPQCIQWSK